jgi:xanthine/uracil permease
MLFSLASMAEATGQTLINGEIVGRAIDPRRDVAKTIRGDALMSLIGGLFGSSLLVTSGENIGIVRVTGVRSRFVTAGAGLILVAIGVLVPIARVIDDIPAAVVGGTALVVYAIVTVLGIQMLRRVDFTNHANVTIAASGLAVGLLPILVPGIYKHFPADLSVLLGSGVAMGAFVSVIANVLFNHVGRFHRPAVTRDAMPIANTAQISTLTSA